MKRNTLFSLYILLAILAISNHSYAQTGGVSINKTGAVADSSAMLDVSSTNKGFLPPRMTKVKRDSISGPATGLEIYQTDATAGLYCNNGTAASPNWQLVGPATTMAYGYFYSPIENVPFNYGFDYAPIAFTSTGPVNNMVYIASNKLIVILTTGIYKITYHLGIELQTNGAGASAVIKVNSNPVGTFLNMSNADVDGFQNVSDEGIFSLNAGDAVTVELVNQEGFGSVTLRQASVTLLQIQ